MPRTPARSDRIAYSTFGSFATDGDADRMAALRGGQDALDAGEVLRRLEHVRLADGAGFHIAVVIELAERGAHAVEAQAARVVGVRHEAAAERIHLRQRADHARVTEIIRKRTARKARAALRLDGDDLIVALTAQLFAHERRDQTAEV